MSDQTERPVSPTEQAIGMFEKLANELGEFERTWQAYTPGYGEGHDHGKARAYGIREAIVAIRDVAKLARRDTAPAVAELEAGAASLRKALREVIRKSKELEVYEVAEAALEATLAGKPLLDRIKALEEQKRLLSILAEGCPDHLRYKAKREPVPGCTHCDQMWSARQALFELTKEATNRV